MAASLQEALSNIRGADMNLSIGGALGRRRTMSKSISEPSSQPVWTLPSPSHSSAPSHHYLLPTVDSVTSEYSDKRNLDAHGDLFATQQMDLDLSALRPLSFGLQSTSLHDAPAASNLQMQHQAHPQSTAGGTTEYGSRWSRGASTRDSRSGIGGDLEVHSTVNLAFLATHTVHHNRGEPICESPESIHSSAQGEEEQAKQSAPTKSM